MFQVVDHRFDIDCDDRGLDDLIADTFAHCIADGPLGEPDETISIRVGGDTVEIVSADEVRTVQVAGALQAIVSMVNLRGSQRRSPSLAVLHGGAVATDGEATLILGRSGSGKSTLVATMTSMGAEYLADELVVVRSSTCVTGYPKSITLKEGAWAAVPFDRPARSKSAARFVGSIDYASPEHAGASTVLDAALPSAIVFPTWEAGADPSVVQLAPTDALLMLCETAHTPVGAGAFFELADLAARCSAHTIHYSTSAGATNLLQTLRGAARPPIEAVHYRTPDVDGLCAAALGSHAVLFEPSSGKLASVGGFEQEMWAAAVGDDEHPLHELMR